MEKGAKPQQIKAICGTVTVIEQDSIRPHPDNPVIRVRQESRVKLAN